MPMAGGPADKSGAARSGDLHMLPLQTHTPQGAWSGRAAVAQKRVVMLTDYYPPHVGGIEQVVRVLVHGLAERRHDVEVVSYTDEPMAPPDGVRFTSLPSVQMQKWLGVPSSLPLSLSWGKMVQEADVVHAHNFYFSTTMFAHKIRRRDGGRRVLTAHLGDLSRLGGGVGMVARGLQRHMVPRVARRFDDIIAVSKSVRNVLLNSGVDERRIHLVPNGVDTREFHPAPDKQQSNHVVFVGRLAVNKGPQFLVDAAAEVLSEVPDARISIVGAGPLREALEAKVRHAGLSKSVVFRGRVPDVAAVLQEGGLYVRPSLSEGMPLGVLEAMASGMGIVGSDIDGIRDLLEDADCGLLSPPGDAQALASTLVEALEDPKRIREWGRRARRATEERYTWAHVLDETIKIYEGR